MRGLVGVGREPRDCPLLMLARLPLPCDLVRHPSGAAFPYAKTRPFFGGLAPYEAGEVRAYGLLLSDMVARMEMTFDGEGREG